MGYRSIFGFPDRKLMYPYTEESCRPPPEMVLKPLDDQEFCPPRLSSVISSRENDGVKQEIINRRPTFILKPSNEHFKAPDRLNRTLFMSDHPQLTMNSMDDDRQTHSWISNSSGKARLSEIGFMDWAPRDIKTTSVEWPRRFRTSLDPEEPCMVYEIPVEVQDPYPPEFFPTKTFIPSLGRPQVGCRPVRTERTGCMFGFATSQVRLLKYLPRWYDWLNTTTSIEIETVMVLKDPKDDDPDQSWNLKMIANSLKFPLIIKSVPAERYELRYLKLVRHMWLEAIEREAGGHHRTDWFIIADDDTYFLSLDSLDQILSRYNPLEPHLIGGSSESRQANSHFGKIAFGGAGIFLSRGLMQKINAPKGFESCLKDFGHEFGGDSMVTKCAIKLTSNETFKAEPTLHQLDIRDEGHGIFQAGLQFTTIHHWDSWFQLQPKIHPFTIKNPLELIGLLGQAARIVGANNWAKRYVWGFGNSTIDDRHDEVDDRHKNLTDHHPRSSSNQIASSGAIVISLGYSITIYANSILSRAHLDQVEHTFAAEKMEMKTRPAFLETRQRRTYYLRSIKLVEGTDDRVAVLTHINQEGEMVDLVWDGRPRPKSN